MRTKPPTQRVDAKDPIVRALFRKVKLRGITDDELGAVSGYEGSQIGKWRRGDCAPRLAALHDIAQAVGSKIVLVGIAA